MFFTIDNLNFENSSDELSNKLEDIINNIFKYSDINQFFAVDKLNNNEKFVILENLSRNINIFEDDDKLYIDVVAPYIPKENINITVDNDVIIVEHNCTNIFNTENNIKYILSQCYLTPNSNIAKIKINSNLLDTNKIEAKHHNGVFTISIEKKKNNPKKVTIE